MLTTVGDVTKEQWEERYEWMAGQGRGGYYLLVIDDGERVVGTGALIVERKLYVSLLFPLPPQKQTLKWPWKGLCGLGWTRRS